MINIENSTELHRLNYYTQAKQKLTPKIKVNLSPSPDYLQNHPWNTDTLPIPNNRSKSITAKSDKSTMKIDRENGNTGYAAPTIFPKTIAIEANRWIAFNTRQSEGLLCVNQIHRRFEQIFNFAARKSFGVLLWDDTIATIRTLSIPDTPPSRLNSLCAHTERLTSSAEWFFA